jgi:pyruvate dehydrogenase (quinone)
MKPPPDPHYRQPLPGFGKVVEAMGLWGRCVSKAGELEEAIVAWLAQPGPALLDIKNNSMQLVMPPPSFIRPGSVVGMAVYTAKAMLHGKDPDVWEMIVESTP